MKTYQFREVFTVTRPLKRETLAAVKRDFAVIQDEPGEYLYGGSGKETIAVKLEMQLPRPDGWPEVWVEVPKSS